MSNRSWLFAFAFVGLAVIAATAWWLVERHDERERAYQAAHKQYEYSKGDQIPGARIQGKRSVPDPKAYREEWRNERDLQAQREMADWAFYMLVVSCAGIVVTSIGVIYVARTLTATREAVAQTAAANEASNAMAVIAEKQFIASHRPRLRVRFVQALAPGTHEPPSAVVTFANIGETDAIITGIGEDIAHRDPNGWEEPGLLASIEKVGKQTTIRSGDRFTLCVKAAKQLSGFQLQQVGHGQRDLCLVVEIQYKDAVGIYRHTSLFRIYDPVQNRYVKAPEGSADAEDFEYED